MTVWNSLNALKISAKRPVRTYDFRRGDSKRTTTDGLASSRSFGLATICLWNRPPLSHLAAERSSSQVYNSVILQNQGRYRAISVNDTTLHILQDELENTISIQGGVVSPNSMRYCGDDPTDENEHASREEPFSDMETDKHQIRATTSMLLTKLSEISAQVPASDMWCAATGTVRRTIPPKPPHYIRLHFIDAFWKRFDKNNALLAKTQVIDKAALVFDRFCLFRFTGLELFPTTSL